MAPYVLDIAALDTVEWTLSDWELTEWTFWSPPKAAVAELHARWGWSRTKKTTLMGRSDSFMASPTCKAGRPTECSCRFECSGGAWGFASAPTTTPIPMDWRPLKLDMAHKRNTARLRRMNSGAEVQVLDFRGELLDKKRKDGAVQNVANEAESVWTALHASLPLPPFPGPRYPGRHTGDVGESHDHG